MDNFPDMLRQLVFISGIGLLLLSTSARYGQLEAQLKEISGQRGDRARHLIASLSARARHFRLATQSLYASIGLLSGGVLLGSALYPFTQWAGPLVLVTTAVAHVFVFCAVIALLRESRLSIEVFEHQVRSKTLGPSD